MVHIYTWLGRKHPPCKMSRAACTWFAAECHVEPFAAQMTGRGSLCPKENVFPKATVKRKRGNDRNAASVSQDVHTCYTMCFRGQYVLSLRNLARRGAVQSQCGVLGMWLPPRPKVRKCKCGEREKIVYHAALSPLERSYFPITMSSHAIISTKRDQRPATIPRRRRRRPH